MEKRRVEILDGLRVVAVLMVMLHHFYYRFEETHYKYSFKSPIIFKYFNLGVPLFFIISGFVITLSMTNCKSFSEFLKKRLIRLIPGMMICSFLTFLFLNLFDTNNLFEFSKDFLNLVISDTFISPLLIDELFGTNFQYTDGSYWSLWAELQFYILAGFLFFISPQNFLKNYSIFAIISVLLYYVFFTNYGFNQVSPYIGESSYLSIHIFFKIFSLFEFNLWFLTGVIINKIYFGNKDKKLLFFLLTIFLLQMALLRDIYAVLFTIIVLVIFVLFLYKQTSISLLANRLLYKIGIASYSIYLIHENIGVVIINKLSRYFGNWNWLLPIILIIIFCIFGIVSYKFFEIPFGKKLKTIFLTKFSFRKTKIPSIVLKK